MSNALLLRRRALIAAGVAAPAPVVTLVYAGQSVGGAYTTESGNATFSLSGGETLAVYFTGIANADLGDPTISGVTLTKQTGAFNAWTSSGNAYGGWYAVANAGSGSHTVTPPTIAGGQDGLIRVLKITNMTTTLTVRTTGKTAQTSSSTTISVTTLANVNSGDVMLGGRQHENNTGSTSTITQPSGWTSLIQYLDGNVNLPTDVSYKISTSGGSTVTATWTSSDGAIHDTEAAVLVLSPT